MKKMMPVLAAALLISACASEKKYDQNLNRLIGQPVSAVEAQFGKPSAAKILDDDSRIITYTKIDESYVPSEYYFYSDDFIPGQEVVYSPFNGNYNFYPFVQSLGYTVEFTCQTSFLIENGIVRAWRWKGNNCVAY